MGASRDKDTRRRYPDHRSTSRFPARSKTRRTQDASTASVNKPSQNIIRLLLCRAQVRVTALACDVNRGVCVCVCI